MIDERLSSRKRWIALQLEGRAQMGHQPDRQRAETQGTSPTPEGVQGNVAAVSYGARLRELREMRGLTQTHVAQEAGIDQSALAHIEAERTQPRIETLEKILAVLDAHLVIELQEGGVVDDPR